MRLCHEPNADRESERDSIELSINCDERRALGRWVGGGRPERRVLAWCARGWKRAHATRARSAGFSTSRGLFVRKRNTVPQMLFDRRPCCDLGGVRARACVQCVCVCARVCVCAVFSLLWCFLCGYSDQKRTTRSVCVYRCAGGRVSCVSASARAVRGRERHA